MSRGTESEWPSYNTATVLIEDEDERWGGKRRNYNCARNSSPVKSAKPRNAKTDQSSWYRFAGRIRTPISAAASGEFQCRLINSQASENFPRKQRNPLKVTTKSMAVSCFMFDTGITAWIGKS